MREGHKEERSGDAAEDSSVERGVALGDRAGKGGREKGWEEWPSAFDSGVSDAECNGNSRIDKALPNRFRGIARIVFFFNSSVRTNTLSG